MEPSPKRQGQHDHDTDGTSRQGEVARPQLNGHHVLNTFRGSGIQSTGNFTVSGDLHMIVNNSTKTTEEGLEKRSGADRDQADDSLFNSLKFSEMNAREFSIKKAHTSTCQWILNNRHYERWARRRQDTGSDRFIWLKGKPGTGKSTMMKFLLGHIRQQLMSANGNEILISFFFNARGTALEKTALGLYRSLLSQLLKKVSELENLLREISQISYDWTVDSLESIFEQALQVLHLRRLSVICLIDALDECGLSEAREMVGFFQQLAKANDNIYVCFASRHYPHISIDTSLEIVLERQPEHRDDIKRYLGSRLQIGYGKLSDQVSSEILTKSSGVFMWVVLVVGILNREFDAGRKHTLRKRLEQIPEDLHELFRDIITRDAENVAGLRLCIQWILFAQRPLAPRELYFAIIAGLEPEYLQTCHFEDIVSEDDVRKYILDNSKGLAESIESRVHFIHESVVDFLVKENGLATIFTDLDSEMFGRSHNLLKSYCLEYIEFVDFYNSQHKWNPSSESTSDPATTPSPSPKRYPFEDYAREQFVFHAEKAEAGGIKQTDFMKEFALGKWIRQDALYPPSPLYLLSKMNAVSLVRGHPTGLSCFNIEETTERLTMPILGAFTTEMVLALLEMEGHRERSLSFQDLSHKVPHPGRDDLLLAANISLHRNVHTLVQLAQFAPELVTIAYLRTVVQNVNGIDHVGCTPIFYAILRDHYSLLSHLIDAGADLSLCDRENRLPTHWAVLRGSIEAFDILSRKGCDIDARDEYGKAPIHYTIRRDSRLIECLIRCGVDINSRDKQGRTLLHRATRHERCEELHILLQNKADIDAQDEDGRTPLHYAVGLHDLTNAEELLSNGANASATDHQGQVPLRYALWSHWYNPHALLKAIRLLQNYGADISAVDRRGETLLHWSFGKGLHCCVIQLVNCGADVSVPDKNCYTPIWWAIYASPPDVVAIKYLIDHGANIRDPDQDGYTLLHRAVEQRKFDVVKVLIHNGAFSGSRNKHGQSPLDQAVSLGFEEISQFLSLHIQ